MTPPPSPNASPCAGFPNTQMIEHLWAPLASDIDLVLRGSSGAAVAPSTGPGAPAAAGAPVEGLTHLGVAIQLMQWLAECG